MAKISRDRKSAAAYLATVCAARLSADLGSDTLTEVQRTLAQSSGGQRAGSYTDPVSLAGLLVSVAGVALNIYAMRKPQYRLSQAHLEREVKRAIVEMEIVSSQECDLIARVFVEELLEMD